MHWRCCTVGLVVWCSWDCYPYRRRSFRIGCFVAPRCIGAFLPSACHLWIVESDVRCFSFYWHLWHIICSLCIHLGCLWSGRLALLGWLGLPERVVQSSCCPQCSWCIWPVPRISKCIDQSFLVSFWVSVGQFAPFLVLRCPGIGLWTHRRINPKLLGYRLSVGLAYRGFLPCLQPSFEHYFLWSALERRPFSSLGSGVHWHWY